jgi:hypothetical protein
MSQVDQLLAQAGFTVKAADAAPAAQSQSQQAAPDAAVGDKGQGGGATAGDPNASASTDQGVGASNQGNPADPTTSLLKGIAGGRFEKLEDLNAHFDQIEKKATENPFANEYVKGLNDAIKNGIDPEVYASIAHLDPEKTTDRDALVLKYQWSDKLTEEEASLLVDREYRLGEDEDPEDEDVKFARIKAKTAANQARQFLNEHKVDQLTPPFEKQVSRQREAWANHLQKAIEPFKTLKVSGKSGEFEIPVSEGALKKAQDALADVINTGKVMAQPDERGMEMAQSVIKAHLITNNLADIIDYLHDQFQTAAAQDHHNPGGVRRQQQPTGQGKDTPEMSKARWMATQYGIKL